MSEDAIRIIERKPAPFPVLKSAGEVYRGVFTNFFGLLRAAWLPLLVYVALVYLKEAGTLHIMSRYLQSSREATNVVAGNGSFFGLGMTMMLVNNLLKLLYWVAAGIAAVAFHRFVLLGERKHGWKNTGIDFSNREQQYLAAAAIVAVTVGLPLYLFCGFLLSSIVMLKLPTFGPWLLAAYPLSIVVGGVLLRASLVLPHVALGHERNVRLLWNKASGQTMRLIAFVFIVALPLLTISFFEPLLLKTLFDLQLPLLPMLPLITLVAILAWVISLMISITSLSIAYREIIGLSEPATPSTPRLHSAPPSAKVRP